MKMYFEDNSSSKISKLLLSINDDAITMDSFTDGSNNMRIMIKSGELTTPCVCYFDMVPDNPITVKYYCELCDYIKNKDLDIYLIPIPCIEYVALKYLYNKYNSIKECQLVKSVIDFEEYAYQFRLVKSYEKYCKAVMGSNELAQCFRATRDKPGYGRFFIKDCVCDNPNIGDDHCIDLPMCIKAAELIKTLPCYSINVGGTSVAYTDVYEKIKNQYKLMWYNISSFRNVKYDYDAVNWIV